MAHRNRLVQFGGGDPLENMNTNISIGGGTKVPDGVSHPLREEVNEVLKKFNTIQGYKPSDKETRMILGGIYEYLEFVRQHSSLIPGEKITGDDLPGFGESEIEVLFTSGKVAALIHRICLENNIRP